jgi:hypothetical protein
VTRRTRHLAAWSIVLAPASIALAALGVVQSLDDNAPKSLCDYVPASLEVSSDPMQRAGATVALELAAGVEFTPEQRDWLIDNMESCQ